jgi:hypothetical protein
MSSSDERALQKHQIASFLRCRTRGTPPVERTSGLPFWHLRANERHRLGQLGGFRCRHTYAAETLEGPAHRRTRRCEVIARRGCALEEFEGADSRRHRASDAGDVHIVAACSAGRAWQAPAASFPRARSSPVIKHRASAPAGCGLIGASDARRSAAAAPCQSRFPSDGTKRRCASTARSPRRHPRHRGRRITSVPVDDAARVGFGTRLDRTARSSSRAPRRGNPSARTSARPARQHCFGEDDDVGSSIAGHVHFACIRAW